MGNELFHNKWHGFNHFTVPVEGFPDSATDPIASREYPFLGTFFNSITGVLRSAGRSNSEQWWFYSSLTKSNSSWWNYFPIVESNTLGLTSLWNLGFNFYTTFRTFSGKYNNLYNTTLNLSASDQYDIAGGTRGPGGIGWHIALSATTHVTNRVGVNTHQKVARPVKLNETGRSIVWNLSAQTVYINLTGNYTLSADNVIGLKKGGKYTMWAYIDRCPEEKMNLVFDRKFYTITKKELSGTRYIDTATNVVRLSTSSLTRLDFTCDGRRMFGRATQYSVWVPTARDLYFKGVGLRMLAPDDSGRTRSPVYVNTSVIGGKIEIGTPTELLPPLEERAEGDYLVPFQDGSIIISPYSTNYTNTSSLYVDGPPLSGISMRFLNANTQYVNFLIYNGEWPSSRLLNYSRQLTGSFDRIVGTLSGRADFRNRAFAGNLICCPGEENINDPLQALALPVPPYELVTSNLREVKVCTSAYEIEIYSGKDREIDSVLVNGNEVTINPATVNGNRTPYTSWNERTCSLTFQRIQEDNTIEAFFKAQAPLTIPNNLLWFNSIDNTLVNNENGPIIDYYISWNLGTTVVTAYLPGEIANNNNNDRPRINTFRSDGSFVTFMSAGYEVLFNNQIVIPWGNRLSGYEAVSISVPGSLAAGVDIFAATNSPPTNISPTLPNWTSSTDPLVPNEVKYTLIKNVVDYRNPITPISIGFGATVTPWPLMSFPTIKTFESTSTPQSVRPLTTFYSNTFNNIKLFQYNLPNSPNLINFGSLRGVQLNNGKFMTLNRQITALSATNYLNRFTTFTVISTTNTFSKSSFIWWLGDFYTPNKINKGYGLVLSANKLYNTFSQFGTDFPSARLSANKLYVISTKYSVPSNNITVNNVGTYNSRINNTDSLSSLNFIVGKNPQEASGYCDGIILFDFYLFNRDLSRGEVITMNRYLIDKFNTFIG